MELVSTQKLAIGAAGLYSGRMDFERVLRDLAAALADQKVRHALIGGFALGALGVGRATMDLDFLVDREDMPLMDGIMAARRYRILYRSENVTQYGSDTPALGQVDVLHAFRPIARGMLSRARTVRAFGGAVEVRVLEPGDIIGLKVQAMANDPARGDTDMQDIRDLARRHRNEIDWGRVRDYYELFGRSDLYARLQEELGNADGV